MCAFFWLWFAFRFLPLKPFFGSSQCSTFLYPIHHCGYECTACLARLVHSSSHLHWISLAEEWFHVVRFELTAQHCVILYPKTWSLTICNRFEDHWEQLQGCDLVFDSHVYWPCVHMIRPNDCYHARGWRLTGREETGLQLVFYTAVSLPLTADTRRMCHC